MTIFSTRLLLIDLEIKKKKLFMSLGVFRKIKSLWRLVWYVFLNWNLICFCLWRSQADFSLGSGFPDRFQWIVWSTVGHSLVAASNNDLYYIGDVTKASTTSHRLTSTGEFNTFYNGMADRLYEGKFWKIYHVTLNNIRSDYNKTFHTKPMTSVIRFIVYSWACREITTHDIISYRIKS